METEYRCCLRFAVVEMLELINQELDVPEILTKWYMQELQNNFGAYIPFVGIVREEGGISALSFDVYEPLLKNWFNSWQATAKEKGAKIKMAHSKGDVRVHASSFIAAVFSPKRRVALELIDEFVEDFKANAPIWKYDVINNKRVYAKDRSMPIKGSGILGKSR